MTDAHHRLLDSYPAEFLDRLVRGNDATAELLARSLEAIEHSIRLLREPPPLIMLDAAPARAVNVGAPQAKDSLT